VHVVGFAQKKGGCFGCPSFSAVFDWPRPKILAQKLHANPFKCARFKLLQMMFLARQKTYKLSVGTDIPKTKRYIIKVRAF
jgi:hypothetical protein